MTDQVVGTFPTPALGGLHAVQEPHRHIAAGVPPQPIGLAVAVEIALPTIDHVVGTALRGADCKSCVPFISHTARNAAGVPQATSLMRRR